MKAISIRQPWAWLITEGIKPIENRTWPTAFRGQVLIHASQQMSRPAYWRCFEYVVTNCAASVPKDFVFPSYEALRKLCGGIVGAAHLVDCIQEAHLVDCVQESERCWFNGPFGFVFERPIHLHFERMKGRLKFFTAPHVHIPPVSKSAIPNPHSEIGRFSRRPKSHDYC